MRLATNLFWYKVSYGDLGLLQQNQVKKDPKSKMHFAFSLNHISILDMGAVAYSSTPVDLVYEHTEHNIIDIFTM